MMNDASLEYLEWVSGGRQALDEAAGFATTEIGTWLRLAGVDLVAVTHRIKDEDGLARKIRLKGYPDPRSQVTDLVGIRVITLFRGDVDRSVQIIKDRLEVNEAESVDKRAQLSTSEFGYRSVHLITTIRELAGPPTSDEVLDCPIEIQIRSVLEHAWGEIDHDLVYKSETDFTDETLRTFRAVAGTLELMDQRFDSFRAAFKDEVATRKAQLDDPPKWAEDCDAAMMVAVLEALAGDTHGWRSEAGATFPRNSAGACHMLLRMTGLTTPAALRTAYQLPAFLDARDEYAALAGLATEEVPHLAIAALLAGTQDGFDMAGFSGLYRDPHVRTALGIDAPQAYEPG